MDLGHSGQEPATARLIAWVLALAGQPGAFGEGCHPARHEQKACEHYLAGFFAPAPATERLAPITMPCGKTFRAEAAARFAVSCLGLRAVLMAGLAGRASVKKHLTSLSLLAEVWNDWGGYYAPDLVASALHPLAIAPPVHRGATLRTASFIADNQQEDGTWSNADLFHTLESLMAANTPPARKAVARAVPALHRAPAEGWLVRADGTGGAGADRGEGVGDGGRLGHDVQESTTGRLLLAHPFNVRPSRSTSATHPKYSPDIPSLHGACRIRRVIAEAPLPVRVPRKMTTPAESVSGGGPVNTKPLRCSGLR